MDRIGWKQTMTFQIARWIILGVILGGALDPVPSEFPLLIVSFGHSQRFWRNRPWSSDIPLWCREK